MKLSLNVSFGNERMGEHDPKLTPEFSELHLSYHTIFGLKHKDDLA